MFVSKKTSIRSCFFKIFVTDLNTKLFDYQPWGKKAPKVFIRQGSILCRKEADQASNHAAIPFAEQKVSESQRKSLMSGKTIQKDFLHQKTENWTIVESPHSLYFGLSRLRLSKQTYSHKKKYQIIRPLLYLSRNEVSLICKKLLIPVYPDKSNQCINYSRNRIRKQLLPSLKLFYNPQIEQALFQFAEFVCKEQNFIAILLNAIPHNFLKIVKVKKTK